MKKTILIFLLTFCFIACKENNNDKITQNKIEIKFNELDSIKSASKIDIVEFLKKNEYTLLNNEYKNQWASENNENLIQFDGKKTFLFFTYNFETYNKLLIDLQRSEYKSISKDDKNGVQVESYIKESETILASTMKQPNDGKQVYTLSFLY
jgi:hypothetical protein